MRLLAACGVLEVVPLSLASTLQVHADSLLKVIVAATHLVSNTLYMSTSLAQLVQTSCTTTMQQGTLGGSSGVCNLALGLPSRRSTDSNVAPLDWVVRTKAGTKVRISTFLHSRNLPPVSSTHHFCQPSNHITLDCLPSRHSDHWH